ncbi:MAG: tRNA pseudouridine(55) synthase TruB [Chloroflexi bacterium]|nr:tRNA pseudouridine(55) synthase TruB [Chloroflexota bacterium]
MDVTTTFGLLNLDKPPGPTSHDLVARVRRGTGVRKVGHAGTLDPMATGVLVLCLGPATRLSEYVMASSKTYRAQVHFGVETNTYDADGEVVAQNPDPVAEGDILAHLPEFQGEIAQVPPMYSAIKRGGKKLYELARAGAEVEREPRPVTIQRLDLLAWEPPVATLEIECSPGTYIRSLAQDLGRALGVGAHLAGLERAASGGFTVEDAVGWDEFAQAMEDGTWPDYVLPPDVALLDMPVLHLDPPQAANVRNGIWVRVGDDHQPPNTLARAYDAEGRFFAVLERRGSKWKPHKVFNV